MPSFDYIIVGAGSAGCVIANRLSENPDIQVLLIEAGESDGTPESAPAIHDPGQNLSLWFTNYAWQFLTMPQDGLLQGQVQPRPGRPAFWPRGRVLGGSSSISSMVYIRGNRGDYDDWAQAAGHGWGYNEALRLFRKSEHQERGENCYHGVDGPMAVSDIHGVNPATNAFVDGAIENGFAHNPDFNGERQSGAGLLQVNIRNGLRESAATAFLNPIRVSRDNLTIETQAVATRILFDGDRAIGVEYMAALGPASVLRQAHARSEVIVSAGAVNSPRLLMLSGIGDEEDLTRCSIPVRLVSPDVGRNLQDHPVAAVGAAWPGGGMSAPPAAGGVEGCLYAPSRHGSQDRPDLQILFAHFLLTDPAYVYPPRPLPAGMAIVSVLVRPKSRGYITLQSGDPSAPPLIQPNYLSDAAEVNALADGVEVARAIYGSKAMSTAAGVELAPGPSVQSQHDVRRYVRMVSSGLFHGCGTCRMGNDDDAVVDSDLRVRGVRNLRVADASIMPSIPAGNTNAPSIMIGEKAAELILFENNGG